MDQRQPSQFLEEWKACKRAFMKSPEFNPLSWMYRLVVAVVRDLVGTSGIPWRRFIPWLGVTLIITLALSYACLLRTAVVQPLWCKNEDVAGQCAWMYLHDTLVSYLVAMLLYFYIKATTTSPGVMTLDRPDPTAGSTSCTLFYSLDIEVEHKRLLQYGPLQLYQDNAFSDGTSLPSHGSKASATLNDTLRYHPSPYASYCKKCDLVRPPRCHHCRICNRCILQYDHHCVWLNNCIGYNNLRVFILTLVYATAVCWYGVLLLYEPFYGPLQDRLRHHGGLSNYIKDYMANNLGHGKGLFDIPSLAETRSLLWSSDGRIPVQTVVDVVFPIVFAVGGILAIFLGTHVKYAISAMTTLEYRVTLDRRYESLVSKVSLKTPLSNESYTNPFDQLSYRCNWEQVMGRTWFYHFLPVTINPLPPFVPKLSQRKT